MSILYLTTSARGEASNSRAVGDYLVNQLLGRLVDQQDGQSEEKHVHRDLGSYPLPPISGEDLIGVHGSQDLTSKSFEQHLELSNTLIEELRQADSVVVALSMYNFGVPVVLKQWIDAVCRAGLSFRYTENGPEGLLGVKRAYIVTASGGTPIGSEMDFASPYLEHIFRFLGVEEIHHIDASGSKRKVEEVISAGKKQVDELFIQAPRVAS